MRGLGENYEDVMGAGVMFWKKHHLWSFSGCFVMEGANGTTENVFES